MAVRHSDELYTFGMKGDTLCHFVLGNSERYKPRLFEAERDIVYHVGGRTLFYHAYGNKIYRVKDASTLEVVYKLDFGSLSRITGADVARGGNVRSSYFVTSCMETDHFLFLNVDKGYDSENARRKGEVQLFLWSMTSGTESFFFAGSYRWGTSGITADSCRSTRRFTLLAQLESEWGSCFCCRKSCFGKILSDTAAGK